VFRLARESKLIEATRHSYCLRPIACPFTVLMRGADVFVTCLGKLSKTCGNREHLGDRECTFRVRKNGPG